MIEDIESQEKLLPLSDNGEIILCPNCSKNIPYLTLCGVNNVVTCKIECLCSDKPSILQAKDIIEELTKQNHQVNLCKTHQKASEKYCQECSSWLCVECLKEHAKDHLFSSKELRLTCKDHHQKFISYCKECKMNLCSLCIEKHEKHEVLTLGEINLLLYNDYFTQIDSVMNVNKIMANKVLKELTEEIEMLTKKKKEVEAQYSLNKEINLELKKLLTYAFTTLSQMSQYPSHELNQLSQAFKINVCEETNFYCSLEDRVIKTNAFLAMNHIFQLKKHYEIIQSLTGVNVFIPYGFNVLELKNGLIAANGDEDTVKIWNREEPEAIMSFDKIASCAIFLMELSCNRLLVVFQNNTIHVYNYESYELIADWLEMDDEEDSPARIWFIPLQDGTYASYSTRDVFKIWDMNTYNSIKVIKLSEGHHFDFLLQLENKQLVSCSNHSHLKLWDSTTFECIDTSKENEDYYVTMEELEGNQLACSHGNNVVIWCMKMFKSIGKLIGHKSNVWNILRLPKKRLATSSIDHSIKIWSVETFICLATLTEIYDTDCKIFLLKNEPILVSSVTDNSIKLWNIDTFETVDTLTRDGDNRISSVIELENHQLMSCDENHMITLWQKTIL